MNRPTTEQSDIDMAATTTEHAVVTPAATEQPDAGTFATEQSDRTVTAGAAGSTASMNPANAIDLPTMLLVARRSLTGEIHVEFNNGMWWVIPDELADGILNQWMHGAKQVSFVWDWQGTRTGSFQCNGKETSFNRYIIDFQTMQQRNIDNDRTRRVKVICVLR